MTSPAHLPPPAGLLLAACLTFAGDAVAGDEPTIVLKRRDCWKGCPVYEIKVFPDGRFIYEGRARVKVVGTRKGRISASKLRALRESFYRVGFFSIDYSEEARDRGAPCRIEKEVACSALDPDTKNRPEIAEKCKESPVLSVSVGIRPCNFGGELAFRDGGRSLEISTHTIKRKDVREQLLVLEDEVDRVVGSRVWVLEKN